MLFYAIAHGRADVFTGACEIRVTNAIENKWLDYAKEIEIDRSCVFPLLTMSVAIERKRKRNGKRESRKGSSRIMQREIAWKPGTRQI